MSSKLGFYELLEPHFSLGLAAKHLDGPELLGLKNSLGGTGSSGPRSGLSGASETLSSIVTDILDYLSVEELHSSFNEEQIVYRGFAMFGGEGRANPELPKSDKLTTSSGHEMSWLENRFDFRLTVPRRSVPLTFDPGALLGDELTDLQQLNSLLAAFEDTPGAAVSDFPGPDFKLELLIKTVRLRLPKDQFIPAKVGTDGWLEPDPNFEEVVLEFPTLAFVLEQRAEIGNLDLSVRSWDSRGFDDPGDVGTARFFSVTPKFFLHKSRIVGFGIDRLVADFSDDVTPTEILEQFGIGDDFNGFWLPLLQIFIAPARTTGFAFSARAKDLLIDFENGVSGDFSLDLMRRGGQFVVEPVFYSAKSKTAVEWSRRSETRQPDGTVNVSSSKITIPGDGEMHISVRGSIPPYQVSVEIEEAGSGAARAFDPDTTSGINRPKWIIPESLSGIITIKVTDKGNHNNWNETIQIDHVPVTEAKVTPKAEDYDQLVTPDTTLDEFLAEINGEPTTADTQFKLIKDPVLSQGTNVVFRIEPNTPVPKLFVLGPSRQEVPRRPDGTYKMVLTPGTRPAQFFAQWHQPTADAPGAPASVPKEKDLVKAEKEFKDRFGLYFKREFPYDKPRRLPAAIVEDIFSGDQTLSPELFGLKPGGDTDTFTDTRAAIIKAAGEFLTATVGNVTTSGFASKEKDKPFPHDTELSLMRAETLKLLLERKLVEDQISGRTVTFTKHGNAADADDKIKDSDDRYRAVFATAKEPEFLKHATATVDLIRRTPVPDPPVPVDHPPTAAESDRPPIFRRIGARIKFIRDDWVLVEVNGQLDFVTQSEETAGFIEVNDSRNAGSTGLTEAIQTAPEANKDGDQGVLDFKLGVIYDRPTRRLTQNLVLGFDQQTRDGWIKATVENSNRLQDTIGSLLVFLPLLNAGVDSAVNADGDEAVKNLVVAAAEIVLATTLGVTGMLKFRGVTLFGIELSATELLPDNIEHDSTRFGDLSVLIDYAVDFEVDINLGILTIRSKKGSDNKPKATRVRYRGFGFRFNFQSNKYEAVFDTSKGFELGLTEPGALIVGGPLGPILKINSVKVARQNPLILETDLGLNANLGVVEVESVRVRIPIEPPGIPTIIPSAISVNIPNTLVGKGYLNIRDSGFEGSIDVTLVPSKLRMQASVGLQRIEDGTREITAFFLGIGVEFPSAIPLGNSGVGLYGILGLFGMHYKRDEDTPVNPNLPAALDWYYNKAMGEPHMIAPNGTPTWIAAPDRWSFGLGVVLGTLEGAFIVNLKGMLVLELPGPRILLFVKAQILKPRPLSGKPADQAVGILAVIDLNFQAGYLAIGLIVSYEVKDLLRIEVPIDNQFNLRDKEDWHLYIGSHRNKASADIFGITKGTGYLMFDGQGIPDFPLGPLNGFSIAAGISASLVLGDESSGLYAKVSGSLDAGVSCDPLHFYGQMKLEGRIHLWFIGLGASATLRVEAPEPLYVSGEVCGSIDLWFDEIEGCVGITIGEPQDLPDPDECMIGLSLQSHSPALVEGQATDQPVDSSLGVSHNNAEVIGDMPLDVIPVLQMRYPPVFSPTASGLSPSSAAPTLQPGGDGWISLGGVPGQEGEREIRYEVGSLTIQPALPGGVTEIPVTWWQPARPNAAADSQAADKGVSLALNSWIPIAFPRAYQRCQDQITTIRDRFETICQSIAPPASVLWTFNAHFTITVNGAERRPGDPLPGYSNPGWQLNGTQWPDPPGTQRMSIPNTRIGVHEPDYPERLNSVVQECVRKFTHHSYDPTKVVPAAGGFDSGQALQFPFLQFIGGTDSVSPETIAIAKAFLDEAGDRERIVVESGDVAMTRFLVCGNRRMRVTEFMKIRGIDENGQVTEEIKIPGQNITNIAQLPANWLDASGPWFDDVRRVFEFFSGGFPETHNLFLVEWKPASNIARFEVFYDRPQTNAPKPFRDPPAVMLGIVETLSRAEVEREAGELHHQQEMVNVVVSSLEEGDKRPLLAPDTEYTITANYKGSIRKSNDHNVNKTKTFSQEFKFHTTSASPKRIDPWVLASIPETDAASHFTLDKIQIVFNDASAIQLYTAFGKTLRVVLRKANGNHPAEQPVIDPAQLHPLPGLVKSPFAQTLGDLVAEMPCIPQITETQHHQVFSLDIVLDRGESYVLDIESTPAAEDPLTPIFRTSFDTSRFDSAREFAAVLERGAITERTLRFPLSIPQKPQTIVIPNESAPLFIGSKDIEILADAEMDFALSTALGSNLAAAKDPGMVFLWSDASPAVPVGVLLDAPEKMLRLRPVPVEVSTPAPDDDIIQHFQTGRQVWLELAESGTATIERIVFAAGGCRAVALFKPGAAGDCRLVLRKYRHTLFTTEPLFEEFTVASFEIPTNAAWDVN